MFFFEKTKQKKKKIQVSRALDNQKLRAYHISSDKGPYPHPSHPPLDNGLHELYLGIITGLNLAIYFYFTYLLIYLYIFYKKISLYFHQNTSCETQKHHRSVKTLTNEQSSICNIRTVNVSEFVFNVPPTA